MAMGVPGVQDRSRVSKSSIMLGEGGTRMLRSESGSRTRDARAPASASFMILTILLRLTASGELSFLSMRSMASHPSGPHFTANISIGLWRLTVTASAHIPVLCL